MGNILNIAKTWLIIILIAILILTLFIGYKIYITEIINITNQKIHTQVIWYLILPFKSILLLLEFLLLGTAIPNFDFTVTLKGMPFIVLWLTSFSVFFAIRYKLIHIRFFFKAFKLAFRKETEEEKKAPGTITNRQAMFTALASTVGIGNIGGVAIAITIGGVGSIFWMVVMGFFGMTIKFFEVLLGHMYRENTHVGLLGGPYVYIKNGISKYKSKLFTKILLVTYVIVAICGISLGGISFQANQSVTILTSKYLAISNISNDYTSVINFILTAILAIFIIYIITGGLKRVAKYTEKIIFLMFLLYLTLSITLIILNIEKLGDIISLIISEAFSIKATEGGMIYAIINGVRRSVFSNEAGLGTSAIAHSQVRSNNSVEVGIVAILEPFFDTIIICLLTGISIIITGSYLNYPELTGVLLTEKSFLSLGPYINYLFPIIIFLFSFSTIISSSYYVSTLWQLLLKKLTLKSIQRLVIALVIAAIFLGGLSSVNSIIALGDIFYLSMAIPNIIALYILRKEISNKIFKYLSKKKNAKE